MWKWRRHSKQIPATQIVAKTSRSPKTFRKGSEGGVTYDHFNKPIIPQEVLDFFGVEYGKQCLPGDDICLNVESDPDQRYLAGVLYGCNGYSARAIPAKFTETTEWQIGYADGKAMKEDVESE